MKKFSGKKKPVLSRKEFERKAKEIERLKKIEETMKNHLLELKNDYNAMNEFLIDLIADSRLGSKEYALYSGFYKKFVEKNAFRLGFKELYTEAHDRVLGNQYYGAVLLLKTALAKNVSPEQKKNAVKLFQEAVEKGLRYSRKKDAEKHARFLFEKSQYLLRYGKAIEAERTIDEFVSWYVQKIRGKSKFRDMVFAAEMIDELERKLLSKQRIEFKSI